MYHAGGDVGNRGGVGGRLCIGGNRGKEKNLCTYCSESVMAKAINNSQEIKIESR